jgi:hypothetical protein
VVLLHYLRHQRRQVHVKKSLQANIGRPLERAGRIEDHLRRRRRVENGIGGNRTSSGAAVGGRVRRNRLDGAGIDQRERGARARRPAHHDPIDPGDGGTGGIGYVEHRSALGVDINPRPARALDQTRIGERYRSRHAHRTVIEDGTG